MGKAWTINTKTNDDEQENSGNGTGRKAWTINNDDIINTHVSEQEKSRTAATPSVPATIKPISIQNTAKPAEQSIMHPGTQGVAAQMKSSAQNWINRGIEFTQKYMPQSVTPKAQSNPAIAALDDAQAAVRDEAAAQQRVAAAEAKIAKTLTQYPTVRGADGQLVFADQAGLDAYNAAYADYQQTMQDVGAAYMRGVDSAARFSSEYEKGAERQRQYYQDRYDTYMKYKGMHDSGEQTLDDVTTAASEAEREYLHWKAALAGIEAIPEADRQQNWSRSRRIAARNLEEAEQAYNDAIDLLEWFTYFEYEANRGAEDWNAAVAAGKKAYDKAESEMREDFGNDTGTAFDIAIGMTNEDQVSGSMDVLRAVNSAYEKHPIVKQDLGNFTDDERDMYYYLIGKGNEDAAQKYYQLVASGHRTQKLEQISADAGQNVGTRLLSFLLSGAMLVPGALTLGAKFGESAPNITDVRHALDAGIAQGLTEKGLFNAGWLDGTVDEDVPILGGKNLGTVAQLFASMRDSAIAAALGGGVGTIFLGTDAGYSAYQHALENGATKEEALMDGIAEGVAEAAFEYISIGNLLDQNTGILRSGTSWKEIFKQGGKEILKQAGVEASEEVMTSIANRLSQDLILGENSDYNRARMEYIKAGDSPQEADRKALSGAIRGILDDALGGLLSGGMMTMGHFGISAISNAYTKARKNKIRAANNGILYFDRTQQISRDALDAQMSYYDDLYRNGDADALADEGLSDAEVESALATYNEIKADYEKCAPLTVDTSRTATEQELAEMRADVVQEENPDATVDGGTFASEMQNAAVELGVDRNTFTPETAAEDAQSVVDQYRQMEQDGTLQNRSAAEELLTAAQTATNIVQNAETLGWIEGQTAYDSELALREVIEKTTAALEQNNTPAQTTAPVQNIEIGGMDNGRTEGVTDGTQRNEGVGADQQGRAVAEGTGARAERGRTASLEVRRALAAGEFDLRSPKEAGIKGGSQSQTMQILRDSAVERIDELRQIRNKAAKDGLNVVFFGGTCEVYNKYAKGNKIKPEGINDPDTNTVYLKVDKMNRTAAQLYDHEMMHKMLRENPEMRGYLANLLAQAYTPEGLDRLIAQYCEAYRGCYGTFTESLTEDEYNALYDMYLDELLADAYALIRRGDINTVKAEQVMAAFRSDRTDGGREYAAATERTNGPGEQRYSLSPDTDIEEENIKNGTDALNWLIEQAKESDNPESLTRKNAMYRTDIGQIDFVWGKPGKGKLYKSGYGISHIIAKHGVDTAQKVVEVVAKGTEYDKQGNDNTGILDYRLRLFYDGYTAVLSKNDNENHWLLTGWENEKEAAVSAAGEVNDSSGATAATPTPTRRNGVNTAVSDNSISDERGKSNPSDKKSTDAAYLSLAEKYRDGTASEEETAELQRMVEQAASAAGYVHHLYHGTNAEFTSFDLRKFGGQHGKGEGYGIYLSSDKTISGAYGNRVIDSYTRFNRLADGSKKTLSRAELKNLIKARCEQEAQQMVQDGEYDSVDEALKDTFVTGYVYTPSYQSMDRVYTDVANKLYDQNDNDADIVNEIMAASGANYDYDNAVKFYEEVLTPTTGIDGFKYGDVYLALSSEQVKSADPVTYDDEGNIIPLSERFRTDRTGEDEWKNDDIRYSVEDDAAELDEDYRRAVQRDAAEDEPTEKGRSFLPQRDAALGPDYAAVATEEIERRAKEASLKELRQMLKTSEAELNKYRWAKRKGILPDELAERMKTVEDTVKIQSEELKHKNAEERKQREKRKEEEAKQQQPRIAKKELKATIAEIFSVPANSRKAMNDLIETAANKIIQQGYISSEDKTALRDALLRSGVVNIAPEGYYGEIRSYVQQGRIYVPESVREEFGDDWNDFRKRAWGNRIYLTSDTTDRPIDDWNQDLAQMFPGGFEEGTTDMKEALEQIVRLAEEGSAENITIAEMMERNQDNYGWSVETQMEQLEEQFNAALKSFAEKANVEIKARQEKATEVLKERRRMREMIERESARRNETEQRNRVMKKIQHLNRMRNRTAPEFKAQIDEVLNGIDTVARSISDRGLEDLIDLAKAYEQAKTDNPNFIPNPYVEARLARLQQTQLDDMKIEDVIELGRVVSALVHSVQEANRLHSEEYKAEIDATARSFVEEMKATKGSKGGKLYQWAVENHLSPVRMIRHLGGWAEGGASAQIAQSLENGQTRQMRYLMEASHIFDRFLSSKENKTWLEKASGKNAEWIKVSVPVNYDVNENDQTEIRWQDIEITPMMRVALYMHSLNFDNLRHIEGGGMTIPNRTYYEKGDMQNAYAYGTRVKMTTETVRAIVKDMTEQERTFAGLLREYYDRYSKDHINEVSMILDGFERAGGENYYHIKTDQNFLSKLPDNIQKNISLESIGSIVNERVFSKVPIVLEDASVSLADHIQQISKYYGFAMPIHDFTAIMNFTDHETGNIFSGSVRELMGQQWGAGAQKYLNKLMEDLQSSTGINEMTATFLRNLRGKLAGASLMFNPAVALSQTASYPGAMQTLGARALAEGLKLWERVDTSLIEKYSPLLWYRNQGNSTQELGDYMDGQTMEHKLPWLLGWIQKMDSATVRRLWAASEYYVKNNTDLRPGSEAEIAAGTDEYYQKVAEMFNRAIYDTQPNYSTMQRPQILRSNSDLTKFLTMFKTVPLQYYNMMFEAAGRLSSAKQRGNAEEIKSASKYFARTTVGLISANAIYVAMKALFKVLRFKDKDYRDEEGELTLGSFMKQLGLDFLDTSAGSLIGGAELLDIVERIAAAIGGEKQRYNGVDINAISFLSSIVQDMLDLSSAIGELDGKDIASAIKGIVKDGVMGTLGLPAQNAETYLLALVKWISPETAERYENLFSDRSKSSLSEESGRYLEAAISVYMDNRMEDLLDEVKQELQRLWEAGQKNAIPSAVPSSVTVGGESIALTSAQKAQFREVWSRIVSDNLEALIGTEYYQDADETTQGKMIDRLYRYASEVAKENLGIDYTAENWAASAETDGLPEYLTYYTLRSMLDRDGSEMQNTAAVAAVMDYVIGGISEDDNAEIARLYMGGAEGLIPQTAPTSFTYKDENGVEHAAELDAEKRAKYAETFRSAIGDQLGALMSSPEYADADDKGRAALIGKVFDFAAGVAKAEVAEGYMPDKWILNGFEDMEDGIQLADYIVYHTGYTRLNGKNEDGESASGLKDRRTLDLIDGNDWTDDQKISVYLDDCSNAAAGKVKAMDAAGFSWKQIKTVLTADKQEIAVLQANVSDSAKLKVLEIYCNEKQMAKYQVGYQFGVSFADYAEVMQHADTNGKGSISQDEATAYIKSMGLYPQQAAYLWQMVTDGKNGKNNPFSPTWGAEFYYEMHKNDNN